MTLPRHGALHVRSCSSVAVAETATRSMRSSSSLLPCAGVNRYSCFRSCTSSPLLSSSRQQQLPYSPSPITPIISSNMEGHHNKSKVWHVSRGFVFAGDTRVVYPRLPTPRFYSAPAAMPHSDNDHSFPAGTAPSAATFLDDQNVRDAQPPVVATPPAGDEAVTPPAGDEAVTPPAGDEAVLDEHAEASELPIEIQEDPVPEEPEDDPTALEPPFTPLDYKIPADAFRAAKQAPQGTTESYWSYNMYRGPNENGALETKVKVHYCTSLNTTERVLQQYFMDEKLLGFDLEWEASASSRHGAKKNVSLVQLASKTRIALFHVALYPDATKLVAPSLKKIMEDPTVIKAGVAIKGDCTRMRKFLEIDSKGVFELSNLYKLVKFSSSKEYGYINKRLVSLATQVEEYLRLPLFKGQDVRSSSWSQALKMDQIIYSASDAYAAVQLYAVLDHHRQNLEPTPPLPYFVEQNLPIRLADGIELPVAEDQPPPEQQGLTTPKPTLSDNYLRSIQESLTIEEGGELGEAILLPPQITTAVTVTPAKPPSPPPDSRVIEATTAAADLRNARPTPPNAKTGTYAAQYQLRAYYLWHRNEDLGLQQIAALLRNPPLQISTVINYILESIRLEKLPYHKGRLKNEILGGLPKEMLATPRYKLLVRACEEE